VCLPLPLLLTLPVCWVTSQQNSEIIKRWVNEVQEAVQSKHSMVQFHAVALLHALRCVCVQTHVYRVQYAICQGAVVRWQEFLQQGEAGAHVACSPHAPSSHRIPASSRRTLCAHARVHVMQRRRGVSCTHRLLTGASSCHLVLCTPCRATDRLAVSKLVSQLTRASVKSPLAQCLLVRYVSQVRFMLGVQEGFRAAGVQQPGCLVRFVSQVRRICWACRSQMLSSRGWVWEG
jgi:hypothetical protein